MGLSTEQYAVSTSVSSHNLVIALPGSGKTHTMISFISNLVDNPLNKILALTFTNAAAEEMKARVGKSIKGRKRKQVFISTFHSAIIQMVKKIPQLASRECLIGSSENQYNNFIFKKMNEIYDIRKTAPNGMKFTNKELKSLYFFTLKIVKNRLLKLDNVKCPNAERFSEIMGFDYFDFYSSKLKELKVWPLDFMCREVTKMLVAGEVEPIQCNFLLVDEFQDTDEIQYEWIKTHGKAGTLITVVGDDDQAIYSWRNSLGVKGVEQFKNDFEHNYHTLSMCYRCPPEILLSAERIVLQNHSRIHKVMNTLDSTEGNMYLIPTTDEVEEAAYIVSGMKKHELGSRAILTRTNRQLDLLEVFLKENEIEYKRINSSSIWNNENLIIWVLLLYTVIKPNRNDYLKNVLIELNEDQETISNILSETNGAGFTHLDDEMMWLPSTSRFHHMCREHGGRGRTSDKDKIASTLDDIFNAISSSLSKKKNEFFEIFKNITLSMRGDLEQRVQSMIELTRRREKTELDNEVVTLTTFHGAKGLEWDTVWLGGVNVDKLPLEVKGVAKEDINYEEERRLLFVAMTRAKRELYISWFSANEPSEFLVEAFCAEIEDKLLMGAR